MSKSDHQSDAISEYEAWVEAASKEGMFTTRAMVGKEDNPSKAAVAEAALEFHRAALSDSAEIISFD